MPASFSKSRKNTRLSLLLKGLFAGSWYKYRRLYADKGKSKLRGSETRSHFSTLFNINSKEQGGELKQELETYSNLKKFKKKNVDFFPLTLNHIKNNGVPMYWERLPHYGTGAELRAAPSERVELLCYGIGYEIGHKKGYSPIFLCYIDKPTL